ncbi:hypothetical protein ACLK11_21155 [Escherichia coli]
MLIFESCLRLGHCQPATDSNQRADVLLRRVRFVEGKPLMLEDSYMPGKTVP